MPQHSRDSKRRTAFGVAALSALLLTLAGLAGCTGSERMNEQAWSADHVDERLRLVLEWNDSEGGRAARYEVRRDRTVAYGGGVDASSGRTTWSGPLAGDDRDLIWRRLVEDGWLDSTIDGSGEPRSLRSTVRIETTAGVKRHSVRGGSPEVDRLRATLETATTGRFETTLRSLPQAGDRE